MDSKNRQRARECCSSSRINFYELKLMNTKKIELTSID